MSDEETVELERMNLAENDSPECHLLVRCGWRLYADGFWRHKGMPDREYTTQDAVDLTTMRGLPTENKEPCRMCLGTGWVNIIGPAVELHDMDEFSARCPACNADGKVPIPDSWEGVPTVYGAVVLTPQPRLLTAEPKPTEPAEGGGK